MNFSNSISKVYIDSRFKTLDSVSSSDFRIELSDFLSLPIGAKCFIDEVIIPNSFYNVTKKNNALYLTLYDSYDDSYTDKIIYLNEGNYSLDSFRDIIQTLLNDRLGLTVFTVAMNPIALNLIISAEDPYSFKFYTNEELQNSTHNPFNIGDKKNINSINKTIGINKASPLTSTYATSIVDLRANVHNVYIHSNSLSSFSSLGPDNSKTIIKKVPVNNSYGNLITDYLTIEGLDYVDVSRLQLKTIDFTIKDAYGNIIDFNGVDLSFSLIFKF